MPSVLEIKDLTVALPAGAERKHAVEKINFSIEPGEILCLVGESGSGKSMIAQSIMGLLDKALHINGGEILLHGENLVGASQEHLRQLRCTRMSMIFQEPMTALNPVMRCGQQIDEVLRVHTDFSAQDRKTKILEMLAQVQLSDGERIYNAYPHQLSGGQRQRIMIALALILNPTLLIADEPTTALDVTTQAQILRLIKSLQRDRGMSVLFITHDFGVVHEIADRVAVLQSGQLIEMGVTLDLLKNPRAPYTRMLISSVPSLIPHSRDRNRQAPVQLRVIDLSKIYNENSLFQRKQFVLAADQVNLNLHQGEVIGIVGESGSGKSTLARCIARLIEPNSGKIYLNEEEIAHMPPKALRKHRHRIQIIFQDPYRSLNPRRTIGQAIIEGPTNFGVPHRQAMDQATSLLKLVQLDPKALDRYPHQFSGGQRQRICIARALAMEPDILIADEAVSALDVSVQAQVLKLLADIREKLKLSILFVTHDLRVAAQICDTIIVMAKGKILESGNVKDVFQTPKHDYTRALLDAAPAKDWDFSNFTAI